MIKNFTYFLQKYNIQAFLKSSDPDDDVQNEAELKKKFLRKIIFWTFKFVTFQGYKKM